MPIHEALYSSEDDDWGTPQPLYDNLNAQFGPIALDTCASWENHKHSFYLSFPDVDSLTVPWWVFGNVWCNPPYGNVIGDWMKKCATEAKKGCQVTALVPARVDTQWCFDWVHTQPCFVYFIKGRIVFVESSGARKKRLEKALKKEQNDPKRFAGAYKKAIEMKPQAAGFPSMVVVYGHPAYPSTTNCTAIYRLMTKEGIIL